jgi:hypothetical protein
VRSIQLVQCSISKENYNDANNIAARVQLHCSGYPNQSAVPDSYPNRWKVWSRTPQTENNPEANTEGEGIEGQTREESPDSSEHEE